MLIHPNIYFAHVSRSVPSYATLNHDGATAVLHCLLDMSTLYCFAIPRPVPGTPIGTEMIDFGLIGPNHTFPIIDSPVFVSQSELQLAFMFLAVSIGFFTFPAALIPNSSRALDTILHSY